VTVPVSDPLPAGAAATFTFADPDFPSDVARIVAIPAATPVTSPEELTVATDVLLELHAIGRPVSTLLFASRVTAVACVVCPMLIEFDATETVTLATATAVTETVA